MKEARCPECGKLHLDDDLCPGDTDGGRFIQGLGLAVIGGLFIYGFIWFFWDFFWPFIFYR